MGLKEYARKRHFDKTPEPGPVEAPRNEGGGFFCVQRHDATRLHYDFRLELNGVLVSWAVPKGPSLDPARKALAMKVEDHPFDYGTFEGNIPEGNYGAGSVMLWDKGTYEVLEDLPAEKQLDRGDFKFALHGTKLNGAFAIVHMKNRGTGNEWLLIKKKDQFMVPGYDIDQFAWSVATKRTQDEIANDVKPVKVADLNGAKKATVPAEVEVMSATAVTKPPVGSQWLYEVKWDGVRALCLVKNGKLQIQSRRGNRGEGQYPEFAGVPAQINAKTAWLDGEICVLNEEGRARFELIQPRLAANAASVPRLAETTPAVLFLFDVLYVDGYDLTGVTLEDRKKVLNTIVTPNQFVRISEAYETGGEQMFEAAKQMNLEGIVAKHRESKYEQGRSTCWLKVKVQNEQEFVIAGFTKGEREYFGALVLAVRDNDGFRHVGQVGTGFDQKKMKAIHERLKPLVTKTMPFATKPNIREGLRNVTWVKPEVVCQVRFLEWTKDGVLRAPVFVGLREDKAAEDVVREVPVTADPPTGGNQNGSLLDLSGKELTAEIDGHRLKFSNLDKVYFPKDGWKKRDLLAFYDRAAPWLLPHLADRPLSMKRYPNGIADDFFFQKNAGTHFPDWLRCEPITEHHPPKVNHYPIAMDRASLLYLVNLGCIDQNPWMSRAGNLEHPDWILLDLDPVDTSFDQLVEATLLVREILNDLGLKGYPKTTGGDGMHVYVPVEPIYTYEQVRGFAELISHLALEREPNLFTTPRSVDKRKKGRVYFDYLQIGIGKTIAAPYVVRAYDGAPVATPLDWKEVKPGIQPSDFRIDNAIERFKRVGDLFAPVLAGGQRLETALESIGVTTREKQAPKPTKRARKSSKKA